mmetsp:Transcript_48500/g.134460  ORF Transcript_48500/g.134460 Transcript_48500/m.134460 type:complete len:232 (-) Transcript_48500:3543-4238(-)|eukprot:127439-Prymnesium_polylepis.1
MEDLLARQHMHEPLQRVPARKVRRDVLGLCEEVFCGRARTLTLEAAQAWVVSEHSDQRCAKRLELREGRLALGALRRHNTLSQRRRPLERQAVGAGERGRIPVVVELHSVERALVDGREDHTHVRCPKEELGVIERLPRRERRLVLLWVNLELAVRRTIAIHDEDGGREEVGGVEQLLVERLRLELPACVVALLVLALERRVRHECQRLDCRLEVGRLTGVECRVEVAACA